MLVKHVGKNGKKFLFVASSLPTDFFLPFTHTHQFEFARTHFPTFSLLCEGHFSRSSREPVFHIFSDFVPSCGPVIYIIYLAGCRSFGPYGYFDSEPAI